jgi:NADH-quinone oxidoreductase subunit H
LHSRQYDYTLTTVCQWLLERLGFAPATAASLSHPVAGVIAAFLLLFLVILPIVTYAIWWLRRLLGWMQSRVGPNRVGPEGLLQTPADALKLLTKEDVIPALADRLVFTIAPAIVFVAAFLVYVTLPFGPTLVVKDLNVGVLYIAAVTSLTVIGIMLAAWSSNNKYALIAAFRSAGQMISYEIPLTLALLGPVLLAQTLSLRELVWAQIAGGWFVLFQPIIFLAFFAAALAENNVTPFDIVEAESEIVAGYHVEYSGMKFALFFLAEFANTFTVACLTTVLFLGGWHNPLSLIPGVSALGQTILGFLPLPFFRDLAAQLWPLAIFLGKAFFLVSVVFWLRATLPRVRMDQLMDFGWKLLLPLTLINLFVTGMFVAFAWPYAVLAGANWFMLLVTLFLGARKKPVPAVQRSGVQVFGSSGIQGGPSRTPEHLNT